MNKDGTTNFYSLEEGVKKMQKGLFAFNMELPVGYGVVSRFFEEGEKCDLKEVKFGNMAYPYLIHRKNSPLKEAFRVA